MLERDWHKGPGTDACREGQEAAAPCWPPRLHLSHVSLLCPRQPPRCTRPCLFWAEIRQQAWAPHASSQGQAGWLASYPCPLISALRGERCRYSPEAGV